MTYLLSVLRPVGFDPATFVETDVRRNIDSVNDEMVAAGVRKTTLVEGVPRPGVTRPGNGDSRSGDARLADHRRAGAAEQGHECRDGEGSGAHALSPPRHSGGTAPPAVAVVAGGPLV